MNSGAKPISHSPSSNVLPGTKKFKITRIKRDAKSIVYHLCSATRDEFTARE